MDLQGSENVRAGNSTLGDFAHLPSVFKSCIRFFKVYHKRSYSSATAALSCNKNVFSVCTLNWLVASLSPFILVFSIVAYSFKLCSIGWGRAGWSCVASQELSSVLHGCDGCTFSTNSRTLDDTSMNETSQVWAWLQSHIGIWKLSQYLTSQWHQGTGFFSISVTCKYDLGEMLLLGSRGWPKYLWLDPSIRCVIRRSCTRILDSLELFHGADGRAIRCVWMSKADFTTDSTLEWPECF